MPIKHIVSFSGGAASFVAAHLAVEKYGRENVLLVFCDTLIEDPDLYRFIEEGSRALGCELLRLADGRDPWEVFRDVRYQGNTRTAHCTVELKGKTFARWLAATYQPSECVLHFGFDWYEEHRLKEARKNWDPYLCEALLGAPPYLSKAQVHQIIDDYDIELPRLYGMGFVHNNCGGFCVKAGQSHFANLLEKLPEVYTRHEKEQERLMEAVPTVRPFLRIVRNKVTHYLTLKQYREHLERGGEFDPSEIGGCGCFSDASCSVQSIIATDRPPEWESDWDTWRAFILS
ncbi:phosphoadenosine phosphosulfate reductase family protein [Ochrobactrum sp. EDr1-4]|uniref:phosphoadenosine phosphosulfate reductase domain-containing protein n=1 Tax=Ochrobactrum sp. EDr1-4 TaxID=3368622 RepID=UPI003BA250D4